MTTRLRNIYSHNGVFMPYAAKPNEWSVDNKIQNHGFIFVDFLKSDIVLLVQSVGTGRLYINKLYARAQPGAGIHGFQHRLPEELRVSTWTGDREDPAVPGSDYVGELPREPHFPKLDFWQQLDANTFSLYIQYCNGGDLRRFIEMYYKHRRRIPEHFIWHVAAEIGEALAYCQYGRPRGGTAADDGVDWYPIYHRDLYANNVFINYPPLRGGSKRLGIATDAFPEVVLGDFGESGTDGDNLADVAYGVFGPSLNDWEDAYGLGCILRSMCMAHVPFPADLPPGAASGIEGNFNDESSGWDDRPDSRILATVNAMPGTGPAYSDLLIDTLGEFEWLNQQNEDINGMDATGLPNSNFVPEMEWVVDTLLPLARTQVATYKAAAAGDGYYTGLDVSWTKPHVMPFVCDHKTADGVERLNSLQKLNRWETGRPARQIQRIEYEAARWRALGVSPAAAALARPVYDRPSFDSRVLLLGGALAGNRVYRGYGRNKDALVGALEALAGREARRLNGDEPPSDDDAGSDAGKNVDYYREPRGDYDHRLMNGIHKSIRKLKRALDEWETKRKRLKAAVENDMAAGAVGGPDGLVQDNIDDLGLSATDTDGSSGREEDEEEDEEEEDEDENEVEEDE